MARGTVQAWAVISESHECSSTDKVNMDSQQCSHSDGYEKQVHKDHSGRKVLAVNGFNAAALTGDTALQTRNRVVV